MRLRGSADGGFAVVGGSIGCGTMACDGTGAGLTERIQARACRDGGSTSMAFSTSNLRPSGVT